MILFLDPSSKRTGYALMRGDRDLERSGAIRPHCSAGDVHERIDSMLLPLTNLVRRYDPMVAVVEVPSCRIQKLHVTGLRAVALSVGALSGLLWGMNVPLHRVEEQEWTRGVSKEKRALWVAHRFPTQYDRSRDTGLDQADAIGLGLWWFEQQKAAELARSV